MRKLDDNSKELWNEFKSGDRTSFEKIYLSYYNDLFRYGKRMVSENRQVEDAIQDLFIDLWRRKRYLDSPENVKYYLLKALRHQINRNSKNDPFEESENIDIFLDYLTSITHEESIISIENSEYRTNMIKEAYQKLFKRQREAIHLRFYQGLNVNQTAHIMDVSTQSVCNLLGKAYAILRVSLRDTLFLLLFLRELNNF